MPVLVLLLLAVALEITVLVLVGQAVGVLPTLGLLLAAGALGVWLLRREGRRTLREFSEATRERRPPTRELSDGVLVAAGGVLILLPGFVSDVAGLLVLFPPTRAIARHRMERAAGRRAERFEAQVRAAQAAQNAQNGRTRPQAHGDVIDGEVIDADVVSVPEDDTPPGTNADTASAPREISGEIVDPDEGSRRTDR